MKFIKSLWFWLIFIGLILILIVFLTTNKKQSTQQAVTSQTQPATAESAKLSDSRAQYFPLQSYRVGPYAAGGTGFFGGFIDYRTYALTDSKKY